MSLQARFSENDSRLYSPSRDVAHCFKFVIMEVAGRLEDGQWPYLAGLLKEKGVALQELGEVCAAACKFVAGAVDDKKEKMGDCLARCGFWDVSELANVALCAHIGAVMMGMYWTGAHEATLSGVGPCTSAQDLLVAGRQTYQLLTMSRWRRRWWLLKMRFKKIWAAVRGS